jgi:hypothetical protein
MKTLLAATAALTALALAPGAWAQSQYGSQSGAYDGSGYGAGDYGNGGYGDGGYGQDQSGDTGPSGYGAPSAGGPATHHYPTNGYTRVPQGGAPDQMSPPPYGDQGAYGGDPDGYGGDMAPGNYSDAYGDQDDGDMDDGSSYPTDNGAYQGGWQSARPAPGGQYGQRGPVPGQYGDPRSGAGPSYASADIPPDLLQREERLERRINQTNERGMAPSYATDNLMIVLNSIRDQQIELARRDNGLNFTDRRFIEARLDRLEEQVRALR